MFTKLFNNISIASLLRAFIVSLILASGIFWVPLPATVPIKLLSVEFLLNSSAYQWIFFLTIPIVAFIFNETLNRMDLVSSNYHGTVLFTLLITGLFLPDAQDTTVIAAVVFMLVLLRLLRSLYLGRDTVYSAFDMGFMAGLAYCIEPGMILIVPLLLTHLIIMGSFSARVLIAKILGFGASLFLIFGILNLSGFTELSLRLFDNFTALEPVLNFGRWLKPEMLVWVVILLWLIFYFFSAVGSMIVKHRTFFSVLFIGVLLAVTQTALLNFKQMSLMLLAGLMVIFASHFLMTRQNKWIKDSLYLLFFAFAILRFIQVF